MYKRQELSCAFRNIVDALETLVLGLLEDMVKKAVTAPPCMANNMIGAMLGQIANAVAETLKDILGGLNDLLDFPSPIEGPSQGGIEGLNIIDDIVSLLECDEKPGCPEVSESSLWDGGTVTPDTGISDLQNIAKGFSGILDNLKMLDFKAPSLSFGDLFGAGGCNSGPVACGPPTVKFFGGRGSGAAGNLIIGALGEIMGIDMVDLGINYDRDANAVVIDTCGKGQGAVIRPVVVDGQITNINAVSYTHLTLPTILRV